MAIQQQPAVEAAASSSMQQQPARGAWQEQSPHRRCPAEEHPTHNAYCLRLGRARRPCIARCWRCRQLRLREAAPFREAAPLREVAAAPLWEAALRSGKPLLLLRPTAAGGTAGGTAVSKQGGSLAQARASTPAVRG
eukprot:COSAG01_NODE_521_length_15963_cov_76.378530_7_plen_137_part_00